MDQESGAPAIAALGLIGAVVALATARVRGGGMGRAMLLGLAWTAAIALAVVIPDFRVLVVVAYAPILVAGAPFGWPPGVRFFEAIPWPVLNQAVCIIGGVLWAATATVYQRRSRGACAHCGRSDVPPRYTTPDVIATVTKRSILV